ncbi:DNA repair protein RadC [Candidatus Saccharibacteria bacterium]|nr:DNA repair protein RadC [Candidatus Saccharibacteria bacterium]
MRIKDKFKDDRPREKILRNGVRALSDIELAMAVIGSGNAQADVVKIARRLDYVMRNKEGEVVYSDLKEIAGMGPARIAQVLAAIEFAKRYGGKESGCVVDSPEKILALVADIRDKKQEYFVAITLDGANRVIKKRVITIGTLTASLVHPREVFADAITDRAASIIVVHNHPSGSVEPSAADREVTARLREAGQLLGIALANHIVVSKNGYRSII